jgi:hypothetical protein
VASNVVHASVDWSHAMTGRQGGPTALQALTASARHWSLIQPLSAAAVQNPRGETYERPERLAREVHGHLSNALHRVTSERLGLTFFTNLSDMSSLDSFGGGGPRLNAHAISDLTVHNDRLVCVRKPRCFWTFRG